MGALQKSLYQIDPQMVVARGGIFKEPLKHHQAAQWPIVLKAINICFEIERPR